MVNYHIVYHMMFHALNHGKPIIVPCLSHIHPYFPMNIHCLFTVVPRNATLPVSSGLPPSEQARERTDGRWNRSKIHETIEWIMIRNCRFLGQNNYFDEQIWVKQLMILMNKSELMIWNVLFWWTNKWVKHI